MTTIKARYVTGELSFAKFANGRVALLVDDCRVSINLPDYPLAADEVGIKNYSECEGMLEALFQAGVVDLPHRVLEMNYIDVPICRLLIPVQ